MKKSVVILALVAVVFTVVVNVFQFDDRVYNADPFPSKLIKDTPLFSHHHKNGSSEEWATTKIAEGAAGTSVMVMEKAPLQWYKIQLPDGTMGWIKEDNLEASGSGYIRRAENKTVGLWSKPEKKKENLITEIPGRTWVTRLDHAYQKRSRGDFGFTKIKTEDGKTGWVSDSDIARVGWKQPRLIERDVYRYEKDNFIEEWQGASITDFIEKFSEPYALKNENGIETYYFNNIYLYDGHRKEMGIQVETRDGVINEFGRTGRVTKWIGYFPLSETLRFSFIMNSIWDIFDLSGQNSYDQYGDSVVKSYFSLPRWLSIIIVIIVIVMYVALFYWILFVPYFITHKVAYYFSLNRSLGNKLIFLIALVGALVLGYPYFVFINVNFGVFNNWFLLHFLFTLGMTVGFIGKWRSDLLYQRCKKCRYWSGVSNGSEKIGETDYERTETTSDGRKIRSRGKEEQWIDHRLCSNESCGFKWDVYRTSFSGWSRS